MKINRNAAECPAPVDHRRVVVRMRDRDGPEAADTPDQIDHYIADQADTVPQHVPFSARDQKRALVDAKCRRHANPDQAGFIPERRHMASLRARTGPVAWRSAPTGCRKWCR